MSERTKKYMFIDEGGDSSFYAKRKKLLVGTDGFQPMLNLGMISLTDKKSTRKAIVDFMNNLKTDPLYSTIYSVTQPNWYLHACKDHQKFEPNSLSFCET